MTFSKSLLTNLYVSRRKSALDIAKILSFSENKVRYWLHKYDIPIRSRSEANYCKYNPIENTYSIKNNLSLNEHKIFSLALGLYWGEGHKKSDSGVRITNSDGNLLALWLQFLRSICQVKEEKIKFHLLTFKDIDVNQAKIYWSNKLNLDARRITTASPIKSLGHGTYHNTSKFGVMTIGVYNVHFLKWIMEQLQNLGYNPDY